MEIKHRFEGTTWCRAYVISKCGRLMARAQFKRHDPAGVRLPDNPDTQPPKVDYNSTTGAFTLTRMHPVPQGPQELAYTVVLTGEAKQRFEDLAPWNAAMDRLEELRLDAVRASVERELKKLA